VITHRVAWISKESVHQLNRHRICLVSNDRSWVHKGSIHKVNGVFNRHFIPGMGAARR
jgi:hypothetical protein